MLAIWALVDGGVVLLWLMGRVLLLSGEGERECRRKTRNDIAVVRCVFFFFFFAFLLLLI